jgi:predicted GIY-YIG superfamily endonuclease
VAFYAYMLRCADGSYYTGHTDSLEARPYGHHSGVLKCYTTNRRPLVLIWCEMFETRLEALENERRIKGWKRAKKEALAAGDWEELVRLAHLRGSEGDRPDGPESKDGPLVHPSSASGRTELGSRAGGEARSSCLS